MMRRTPMHCAAKKPKRPEPLIAKRLGKSAAPKKPWSSRAYRAAVRTQPCLICRSPATEAHHIRERLPRTMGKRVSDEWCVPLCKTHHDALHASSRTFWAAHGIDPQAWCRAFRSRHQACPPVLPEACWS